MRRMGLVVLISGLAAACSGGSSGTAPTGAQPVTQVPTHSTPPAPPTPKTALAVARQLKAAIPSVTKLYTYTAASDPNHLLGRPNGYVSKTNFVDSRIHDSDVTGLDKDDPTRGGSVEYFSTANGAKSRAAYLQTEDSASPLFGSEYDYLDGGVLLRVSGDLTPSRATSFKRELVRIMRAPARGPVTVK